MRNAKLLAVFATLFLFGTFAAGAARQQYKAEEPTAAVIHMTTDRRFVPQDVNISVGDTVEWVADDPYAAHTVTDDPDALDQPGRVQLPKGAKPFNSGTLTPGSHWKHRFTVPGVYQYACIPHSSMTGRIVVRASSASK